MVTGVEGTVASDGRGAENPQTHPENQLATIPATDGCQVKPLSYLSSPLTHHCSHPGHSRSRGTSWGEEEEENPLLPTMTFQIPHLGQAEVGEVRNFSFS